MAQSRATNGRHVGEGIVAYLRALLIAVIALVMALVMAAYVNREHSSA
ncbi:MAG: hypothetical protein NTV05_16390 [Acidobacteria bacterium]|nr:hypothetical protein [Acidobacteriota bacterium]